MGTHRVDLAAHLLSDEAQLAAAHSSEAATSREIVAVIGEPDLLFGDVEFLDVEDHLLFQAVVIYLGLQLRQTLPDAGADGFRAGIFRKE